MPWKRMKFRNNKVYVHVDKNGIPLDVNGRAEIKYRKDDDRIYTPALSNIRALDAPDVPGKKKPPRRTENSNAQSHADAHVQIFTDGASLGNPGPAGIGVVIRQGDNTKEISEYIGETTNNVAELTAVLRALESIRGTKRKVVIHSDSSYAIGVLSMGWKVKSNQDLVRKIHRHMSRFSDLHFYKVEGHAGIPLNELADELAGRAAKSRQ